MDHSHVDIVCFQAAQHVLKGSPYLADVPRGFVLAVLPDGTQMRLQHELFPPAPQRASHAAAQVRVRRVQIHTVHARFHRLRHQCLCLFFRLAHKALAPKADLAHAQPGAAQFPVFHCILPFLFAGAYACVSNSAAVSFKWRITGRCCGHARSHWPQPMHSDAFPPFCVRFP